MFWGVRWLPSPELACAGLFGLGKDAMRLKTGDLVALVLVLSLTGLFAWRFVNFDIPPAEDAAMLMRYAEHFAQGNGIVWNIGEPPVDGATDFLFMIVVGVLNRLGLSVEAAVRAITITSHFLTVGLIYVGMRRVQGSGILPAFVSAAYFAVGPGLFLSAADFGTPFFALAIAGAWLLAQRLILSPDRSIYDYLAFSLTCLIAGLIRPEGVLICLFMLVAIGLIVSFKELCRLGVVYAAVFFALGGAYFAWRWQYFGYPLPNPFYKKGGGHFYFGGLKSSIKENLIQLHPFIPAFLLSLRQANSFRLGLAFLVPIAGSVAMWAALSDEMNFGGRFQYPTLAIGILSWFPLVRTLPKDFSWPSFATLGRMQKLAAGLALASVLGVVLVRQAVHSVGITYPKDGRYDVARMLSDYAGRGYTIATTEAGLLPLYSGWRAIDTWGLNDKWIAHHGLITEEYLDRQNPAVIMWHGYFSPLKPLSKEQSESLWSRHVLTLKKYVEGHGFTLAAAYAVSPEDAHYYYVRSDLPDHDEIVARLRSMDYAWFEDGKKSENYAQRSAAQK
jgi:hypothetical protein